MSVLEEVRQDVVRALKAGDRDLAGALRLVVSELQKDAKEGAGDELAVLRREHKRRLEAAGQFQQAGRPELADGERAEARMIERYLPEQLSDEALATIVAAAIATTGAAGPADIGTVMKAVMARADGGVDGRRAAAAVRAGLGA
ncbi:MAG: GatB/YqeY domain-containing protein [Solirubrobacteraceae bacterium]